jgi:hypothetical protein
MGHGLAIGGSTGQRAPSKSDPIHRIGSWIGG